MRRKRHSRAEIRAKLKQLQDSGLSIKAFADQEGLGYSTVLRWRGLKDEPRLVEESGLAPVDIVPDQAAGALEIRLPNGMSVNVPHGFDAREVARLLTIAREC